MTNQVITTESHFHLRSDKWFQFPKDLTMNSHISGWPLNVWIGESVSQSFNPSVSVHKMTKHNNVWQKSKIIFTHSTNYKILSIYLSMLLIGDIWPTFQRQSHGVIFEFRFWNDNCSTVQDITKYVTSPRSKSVTLTFCSMSKSTIFDRIIDVYRCL